MSWNIKLIGKPDAVRKAVEENTQLPETIKAVIMDHLQDYPSENHWVNGYSIEGYGHKNNNDGSADSSFKLEVNNILITD